MYRRDAIWRLVSLAAFSLSSFSVFTACSGRHPPTEQKVKALLARQKWDTNLPTLTEVLQQWVPPGKPAVEDDAGILASVVDQRWRGVDLKDFGPQKGKGELSFKTSLEVQLRTLLIRCNDSPPKTKENRKEDTDRQSCELCLHSPPPPPLNCLQYDYLAPYNLCIFSLYYTVYFFILFFNFHHLIALYV